MGRVEDETALHDAVLLTRPGDDVCPAGRMLLARRWLATRPAEDLLTKASLVGVLDVLGLARDDETAADLADELTHLAATRGCRNDDRRLRGRRAPRPFTHLSGPGSPTRCWHSGWVDRTWVPGGEAANDLHSKSLRAM
ncbi:MULTISPECIES: DUF1403 family protein [unclassified Mesorhizobium]|uniref:DUF1403 family protein n=1 Tax=unclassified Mesorhizobium TaxID=325217 RepID=UPI0029620BBC|nr:MULTISPECIES: DUF1403 family protein [unclassified Mesorhizobium]